MNIHNIIDNETKSLIHLNLMQGVTGSKTIRKLVEVFGSAETALMASPEEIENELHKVGEVAPAGLITRLLHYPLEKELELINKHSCNIITLHDEDVYPELLKMVDRRPPVLYVKGKLEHDDSQSISIVGPRKASSFGQEISHKLGYELAQHDFTVVSGLANGIDTCAHRGTLDAGGRTIAVMGRGLSCIFPSENEELADEIVQSGALISEFPMDVKQKKVYFPQRNRIISGLTPATVVIEAPIDSGSMTTVEHALEQGRKVFAVPDHTYPEHSSGCHKLIEKDKAQRIDSVNDFLKELPQLRIEARHYPSTIDVSEQTSTIDVSEQILMFEEIGTYGEKTPSEEKVKSEVIRCFRNNFPGNTIELEHEIQFDGKERADVALINSKQKVSAVVECKSSKHIGSGLKQLDSYLFASENTLYGFFANSIEHELWVFFTKTDDNTLKIINRSEFEKGVIDSINTE